MLAGRHAVNEVPAPIAQLSDRHLSHVPNVSRVRHDWAGAAKALARAHARTGDAVAIAAYLGTSDRFDGAIADFAETYADVNARDHAAYVAAIEAGRVSMPAGS